MSEPPSTFRFFADHLRPHRVPLIIGTVLLVGSSALGLLQPLAAKLVIEALAAQAGMTGALVKLTVLVLVAALMLGVGNYLLMRSAENVTLSGRRSLVRHVLRLSVPGMRTQQPGDLLARVTSDTAVLRQVAAQVAVQVLTGAVLLVGALVFMGVVDLILLVTTAAVVAVLGGIVWLIMPRIREAALRAQASVGEIGAALERGLGAFTTVKASGAERAEEERVDRASRSAYEQGVALAKWGSVAGTTTGLAIQVAFLVVLGVGGARVAAGSMTVADLVAFLLYVAYLTAPLSQLVNASAYIQAGRAAVTRIGEVTQLPIEDIEDSGRAGGRTPAALTFEKVTFAYPGRADTALNGFSLDVPKASLTALVGPSGSGKTTVLNLVERFYEPTAGTIRLDGRDLRDWDLAELRAQIGYVEQDAAVLAGTLRENLTYAAPEATEEALRDVLRITRLEPLLRRLGDDLDAPIAHRGVSLSGGERQRVAIARALLREPRLLMLDEATSQLDAVNEAALREVVRDIAATTTVVVVAHRLSTVLAAEQIVVLADGAATGVGSHGELLRSDPLYAKLAAEQALV
ncbi:ABC transporter ATP-binding protein [Alloactinosynnema sp. L-07]|uniref:ABC transporter ATP-binding protein n=1 Tax=Alloactinosynnema sp. L-07 TaxID=1653480 RepID=UPI00065F0125|nr:ABC transporter ATP-binding protein [Alloactinosynnema sp. L-07]CRK56204.1 ABC transporter ATP-binding protein [Alloactinosynnema sp. L-07]